ncbi:MAG: DNA polymerase III subunit gamma/tau, partial [Sphingobacteriales bacterium]
LKNAIQNKQLAHAFLFCGPRGVGKTTCARILAKTINCMNLDAEGEACNECTSCISFNNGSSLNIHELDAASNNSVDDIRNLVDQVRFAPQAGEYKVYIIDEVHMLSSSAFNAFLKTLEEPPAYAKFILATTEKHKILPTILSRCQIFDFKRITNQDTVDHLQEICNKEGIKAEKSALHVIAQKSEGCMRDSLSIMDKIASFTNNQLTYTNTLEHLNILDEDYFFRLLENMQQQKLAEALLVFEDINRKGFEGEMVLNGFAEFIRNILVCRDTKTASLLEAVEGFREKYQEAAKTISLSWLVSALQILNEAEINYKQARNRRLHVELCFIKLTYLHQAIEVAQDGAKKKMDSVKPVAFRKIGFVEEKSGAVSAPTASTTTAAPKLTIKETKEEKQTAPNSVSPNQTKPVSLPPQPKFGNLQKIRDQISRKPQVEQNQIPLTQEKLQQAWELYVDKLLKANNPSAATNFRLAVLKILDDQNFDIITEGNIQQKFIESERGGLIEHLQTFFNNKNLKYHLILEENEETKDKTPKDRPIPPREQYQKMVEIYPLIKDLRDRLGMDLDY